MKPQSSRSAPQSRRRLPFCCILITALSVLYPLAVICFCSITLLYPPFFLRQFEPLESHWRYQAWLGKTHDPETDHQLSFTRFQVESTGVLQGPWGSKVTTLQGWFIPASEPTSHLAVLVHGAGMDRREFLRHVPYYHGKLHCNVALFDVSDHGLSGKRFMNGVTYGTQESEDLLRVLEFFSGPKGHTFLKSQNQPDVSHILIHGASNGAATVLMTAGKLGKANNQDIPLRGVIAVNPFADPREEWLEGLQRTFDVWAGKVHPLNIEGPAPLPQKWCGALDWLVPQWMRRSSVQLAAWRLNMQQHKDPPYWVGHIRVPVLHMHSTADELIDIHHAYDLISKMHEARGMTVPNGKVDSDVVRAMRAWSPPVHFWRVDRAEHSLLDITHPRAYYEQISAFAPIVFQPDVSRDE